jgi:dihydropyrimidinase
VLYDPNGRTTISAATHHMNLDYSAWEGFTVNGKVDTVISRGDVLVDRDGGYHGRKGRGRYLKRGLSSYLR